MFRLLYCSGLRRSELLHLKIHDIETDDDKCRIRVVKGKGKKNRYPVLSTSVLIELRAYFVKYRPQVCLFNGRKKSQMISEGAIRHALKNARKRSGITKEATMHSLSRSAGCSDTALLLTVSSMGCISTRSKKKDLDKARKSLATDPPPPKKKMTNREFIKLTTGKDPYLCPCCAIGEMVIISIIPAIRGSHVKIPFRSIPKDRKVNIC
jgi:integrase